MSEISQNTQFLLFGFGPEMHAMMAFVANLLGIVSVIIGIVSGVTKKPLRLGTTNWFILTIIFFIWSMSFWLSSYFGALAGYVR